MTEMRDRIFIAEVLAKSRSGARFLYADKTDPLVGGWFPTLGRKIVSVRGDDPTPRLGHHNREEAVKDAQRFKQQCREFLEEHKDSTPL